MSFYEDFLNLPTVIVTGEETINGIKVPVGTKGRLRANNPNGTSVIFYGPDLGLARQSPEDDHEDDYIAGDIPFSSFRLIELTLLDIFVRNSMLKFPNIHPTREAVLSHSFLVLGNGLDWHNGVLGDRHEKKIQKLPRMKYKEVTKDSYSFGPHDLIKALADAQEEAIREINAKYRDRARWIDYHATLSSQDNLEQSHYESAVQVAYYIDTNHIPLAKIPEDVEPSFLKGAIEILDKVMLSTPEHPDYNAARVVPVTRLSRLEATQRLINEEDKEKDKAKIENALVFLSEYRAELSRKLKGLGWRYHEHIGRALKNRGFKIKGQGGSNGCGYVGFYPEHKIDDDGLAKLDRYLARKGFQTNPVFGLSWERPDLLVRLHLEETRPGYYRGRSIIVSHPEDGRWVEKMWNYYERWGV